MKSIVLAAFLAGGAVVLPLALPAAAQLFQDEGSAVLARGRPAREQLQVMKQWPHERGQASLPEEDAALLSAVQRASLKEVRELLAGGANANVSVAGESALDIAAKLGLAEIARELLERGADAGRRGSSGFTPLAAAAINGHARVVELLARRGVELDMKSKSGHTPLVDAVQLGRSGVARVLLEYGADPLSLNRDGKPPLTIATLNGDRSMAALLLSFGVDPNATDKDGHPPLYWAIFKNRREIGQLLLRKGADPGSMSVETLM